MRVKMIVCAILKSRVDQAKRTLDAIFIDERATSEEIATALAVVRDYATELLSANGPTRQRARPQNEKFEKHYAFLKLILDHGGTLKRGAAYLPTSNEANKARQFCRKKGWATFDKSIWQITDLGREAVEAIQNRKAAA